MLGKRQRQTLVTTAPARIIRQHHGRLATPDVYARFSITQGIADHRGELEQITFEPSTMVEEGLDFFLPEYFQDKIVLLGTGFHDSDKFRTPFYPYEPIPDSVSTEHPEPYGWMFGVEIHANALQNMLDEEYGLYFKVARLFAKVIGNPTLIRELTRVGMHSQSLMEWALAIMANLMRPDQIGPAEAAYEAIARVVRLVPE